MAEWQTRRTQKPGPETVEQHSPTEPEDSTPERAHSDAAAAPIGPAMGQGDPVGQALAAAIGAATTAGRFDVVLELARQLEARRKARLDVVDLSVERDRRGK